jgi:hypothetical protein
LVGATDLKRTETAGLAVGLAVYHGIVTDFRASTALFRKLVGQHVGLSDLEAMDPAVGRTLRLILAYDAPLPLADAFGLTFTYGEANQNAASSSRRPSATCCMRPSSLDSAPSIEDSNMRRRGT